jgi:hypothetical protein
MRFWFRLLLCRVRECCDYARRLNSVMEPSNAATSEVEASAYSAGYADGYGDACFNPDTVEEAFEKTIVAPLNGRYDEKQRLTDFAMFALGYYAGKRT